MWDAEGCNEQKLEIMEKIISAKAEQVNTFQDQLAASNINSIFVKSTVDVYWGTDLYTTGTVHTNPSNWLNENKLGLIVRKIATKYKTKLRSASLPRKGPQCEGSQKKKISKISKNNKKKNENDSGLK